MCVCVFMCESKQLFSPYSGYKTGGVNSSKASLKGVVFHVVDICLQLF